MFPNVAIAVLAGALALLAVYHVARGQSARPLDGRLRALDRIVYALFLLSMAVMIGTSYYAALILHQPMGGYLLMLHASAAGAFLGALVLLTVVWAEACRFRKQDCACCATKESNACDHSPARFSCGQKFWFWAIVLFGLTTALTMLASMLPLFDSVWMKKLYEAHRESSLLLVVALMAHGYLMMSVRRAPRT